MQGLVKILLFLLIGGASAQVWASAYSGLFTCYTKLSGYTMHSTHNAPGGLFLLSPESKEILFFTERTAHHCPYDEEKAYMLKLMGFKKPYFVETSERFVNFLSHEPPKRQIEGVIQCSSNLNEEAIKLFEEDVRKRISKVHQAFEFINRPMKDKTGRVKVEKHEPYNHTAALEGCRKALPDEHPLQKMITEEMMKFPLAHEGEGGESDTVISN